MTATGHGLEEQAPRVTTKIIVLRLPYFGKEVPEAPERRFEDRSERRVRIDGRTRSGAAEGFLQRGEVETRGGTGDEGRAEGRRIAGLEALNRSLEHIGDHPGDAVVFGSATGQADPPWGKIHPLRMQPHVEELPLQQGPHLMGRFATGLKRGRSAPHRFVNIKARRDFRPR